MQLYRKELRPMLQLAIPVVISEVGWVLMSLVDTIMVGRVSPEAIGAVSIGSSIFIVIPIVGIGFLLGLDYLIAHAFGGGDMQECHRWLLHGLYLSFMMTLPLTFILWLLIWLLPRFDLHPDVLPLAIDYLEVVSWSILPLLLYATLRRYMQAINLVKPIMVTLITANGVNAFANWVFVFGHLGFPAMGSTGAAYATLGSKIFLFFGLAFAVVRHELSYRTGLFHTRLKLEFHRIRKLMHLGYPASAQLLLEVGVFSAATVLAGRLTATSLASHQIVLKIASLTFMVPLGISSAGAVRVGQALGAKNPHGASRSGWIALALATAFMSTAAVIFISFPQSLIRIFTDNADVLQLGVSLLYIAAIFQIFDGIQVVATGILRGTGDTRTPMISNLIGHWFLGLPVGATLAFKFGYDVFGLWVGLCIGLVAVAIVLLMTWIRRVRRMIAD